MLTALILAAFTAPAADSPWQRTIVIGASASGGFVLSEPFGGTNTTRCKLHYYLDAAITAPHDPIKNFGTAMFFLSPDALAVQEVQSATNNHPTLVIAIDFMFWFLYGSDATEAGRLKHFEYGLKQLENIPCPLVIGDVPDASSATNTGIIDSFQVPQLPTLQAANERLHQWAAAHTNVIIVPLADFMRTVKSNAPVPMRDATLPADSTRKLMQADGLHPTPRGAAVLTLGILDALVKSDKSFADGDVDWKLDEVYKGGMKKAMP